MMTDGHAPYVLHQGWDSIAMTQDTKTHPCHGLPSSGIALSIPDDYSPFVAFYVVPMRFITLREADIGMLFDTNKLSDTIFIQTADIVL